MCRCPDIARKLFRAADLSPEIFTCVRQAAVCPSEGMTSPAAAKCTAAGEVEQV